MAETALLAGALLTSLLSTGLFLTGLTAWSTVNVNVINVAWSFFGIDKILKTANDDATDFVNTQKFFLGLQGLYITPPDASSTSGKYYAYSDAGTNFLPAQCNSAGEVAFALTLVAAVLSTIVAVFTISRLFDNTPFSKFLTVSGAFFANAVSVTAFCNWHVQCFLNFRDNSFTGIPSSAITGYEYYGFNVVVVGWVFSLVTFVLAIAAPTKSSTGPSTPEAPNQKF